jgi:hypothetical protein
MLVWPRFGLLKWEVLQKYALHLAKHLTDKFYEFSML